MGAEGLSPPHFNHCIQSRKLSEAVQGSGTIHEVRRFHRLR